MENLKNEKRRNNKGQFQNILDKLVESKIQPTATAIISAEQPMILLFEELMCEIDKLQKENKKLRDTNKILYEMGKQRAIQELLNKEFISKDKIIQIRDKAECEDYYSLIDVIDDLSKLIGDYEEEEE